MNSLLQFQFWPGVVPTFVIALLFLRQLMVVLAAEQGRKHDLVKKIYKTNQAFQLSVLIPFLDPHDYPALLALLHAISEQEYPATQVMVHLVTSEETERDLIPQSLRPNVKAWQYPSSEAPQPERALSWLIDRCLAAGGNGMFVFLKPTDLIKPDFFQNIAARGIDSFAVQGYVALKNPPETPLGKVHALTSRLFNRIGNAGRYHLGMSCRLLDTGWAIKQEVLEMVPYRCGVDLDNLEYTMRLNLEGFRVNWAPSVVVYSEANVHFLSFFTRCVGAFFNRISLFMRYGPLLLTRAATQLDWGLGEHALSLVMPPYLLVLITLLALTVLDFKTTLPIPGSPWFWMGLSAFAVVFNLVALVVARCKADDYLAMAFYTPITYLFAALASPLALYGYVRQYLAQQPGRGHSYRKVRTTRFNEELESAPDLYDERHSRRVIQSVLKKNAPVEGEEVSGIPLRPENRAGGGVPQVSLPLSPTRGRRSEGITSTANADAPVASAIMPPDVSRPMDESQAVRRPRETVRSVPVSNGRKQVFCRLIMLTSFNEAGQESYCLTLEYKTVAFSTESYRILDQAFYELQSKLMSGGLTILTCGSCGYFYNPTADVPGALKNSGVCLFNKQGREVNLTTDAVTVISQACEHHCALAERESIVKQWKESLTLSRTL